MIKASNSRPGSSSSTVVNLPIDPIEETTQNKPNPLPYPQFYILLCVRFVEPIAFTIVFPFMYEMIQSFGIAKDETQVAYYAGILASTFAVCEAFTSIFWGILSDRMGRKPIIMFGLFGTALSLFIFGLSPNFSTALVARSMSGLLNGNVGVVKSMVAEMTDSTNRPEAFGYLSLIFGLGLIVGPFLGGFLSSPAIHFPWLFGNIELFKNFPYFLPCLVSSTLCICSLIFGYFFLEETLESKKKKLPETSPLLEDANESLNSSRPDYGTNNDASSETVSTQPKSTYCLIKSIPLDAWIVILSYALLLMFVVMFDDTIVFWGATEAKLGGFQLIPRELSYFFIFGGISMFISQFTFFTPIKQKFGILKIYQNVYILFALVSILTPFATSITTAGTIWSKILPSISFIIRSIIGQFAFNICNVLLVDSSPNNSMLGLINGVSQTFSCIARAIAPALTGFIFSWSLSNDIGFPFDIHFTWFVIGFVALINHILSKSIKQHN